MKHRYLITIIILSLMVIVEGILLVRFWPKKAPPIKVRVKKYEVAPPKIEKVAKIAIVIDDWGYNLRNINFLGDFEYPVTISILPHLPYSSQIAYLAKKNNREVILHLPLEPHEREEIHLEKQVIFTDMSEKDITKILNDAIKNVPAASGVNNHMGSKATEDERVMNIILRQLKKKRLYFLDSLVTPYSICGGLAERSGVKFAQRDIFLDNQSDYKYIANQIQALIKKAKSNGYAIGVGHDRTLTLQVIRDYAVQFEKEGIKLVFVSDVIK